MPLKDVVSLLLCMFSLQAGVAYDRFFEVSDKKQHPGVIQGLCEIDNYYDSIVSLKTDNVLMYKELNTASGNNGLIVWKKENCIFGTKFTESLSGSCKNEQVEPDNPKLGLVALRMFFGEEKNYSVTRSKFETMHDYKIIFQAVVRGEKVNSEYLGSDIWNNSEFLAEVSRLCQGIIYEYNETDSMKKDDKRH